MTFTPVQVLLIIATIGMLMLLCTRRGSTWETIAAVLTVAPLMAIPVGIALGTF